MKLYIIDATLQVVREDIATGFEHAKRMTGIRYIAAAWTWPTGDVLFVDDEGMLAPKKHFFKITDRPEQPLAGSGFVLGAEQDDDDHPDGFINLDPQMSLAELQAKVTFLSLEEAVAAMLAIPTPAKRITSVQRDGTVKVDYEQSWRDMLIENGFPVPDAS